MGHVADYYFRVEQREEGHEKPVGESHVVLVEFSLFEKEVSANVVYDRQEGEEKLV